MADVILDIGGFQYPLACRPGEEEHFRAIAARIDQKVSEARQAVGQLGETRQLLFAALLLADALGEAESRAIPAPAVADPLSNLDVSAVEALATRVEMLANKLENRNGSA